VANLVPAPPKGLAPILLWDAGRPARMPQPCAERGNTRHEDGPRVLRLAGESLGMLLSSHAASHHLIRKGLAMRIAWKVATAAAVLCAAPLAASAGKVEGVGIGAGVGAIVAGPVGAVVGGVVGYEVGGPNIMSRRYRSCWRDEWGYRHCRRR
jgi:hypothetical protein